MGMKSRDLDYLIVIMMMNKILEESSQYNEWETSRFSWLHTSWSRNWATTKQRHRLSLSLWISVYNQQTIAEMAGWREGDTIERLSKKLRLKGVKHINWLMCSFDFLCLFAVCFRSEVLTEEGKLMNYRLRITIHWLMDHVVLHDLIERSQETNNKWTQPKERWRFITFLLLLSFRCLSCLISIWPILHSRSKSNCQIFFSILRFLFER